MSLISSIQGLGGSFFDNMQRSGGAGAEGSALAALRRSAGTDKASQALQGLSLEKLEKMAGTEMQRLGQQASSALQEQLPGEAVQRPLSTGSGNAPSFASMLGDLVESVDQKGKASSQAAQDIMLGKSDNIHQAMIAMQEASVAFGLLVEVRNKLVESYKELTRMQV